MHDESSVLKTEAGEAVIDDTAPASELSVEEQLAAANARADENYNKYLLAIADQENYKKRTEQRIDSIVSTRRRMVLERFLPVLDNLERALQATGGEETLRGGLEQTLRGFEAVLAGEGVKAIDVRGKPFDPRVAEAIGTTDSSSADDDTVVEVAEKGYKLDDDLLRPAKVIVSKNSRE